MSDETPQARQMSGRRSKPSMDLLVDNQRVLSQYAVPTVIRNRSKNLNALKRSSLMLKRKLISTSQPGKPKKVVNENNIPTSVNDQLQATTRVSNGDIDDKYLSVEHREILSRTPTLTLNKIDISNPVISLNADNCSKENVDDTPICKVYPDFNPNVREVTDQRSHISSLPPKKKIKFVNINEMFNIPASVVISDTKKTMKRPIHKIKKVHVTKIKNIGTSHTNNGTRKPRKEKNITEINTHIDKSSGELSPQIPVVQPRQCVRYKCTNIAIDDFRWDREFCSPDCAILHSKTMFDHWLTRKRIPLDMLI